MLYGTVLCNDFAFKWGLVWRENKTQEGAKHQKQNRHTRDVRESNTALCGNQGSPQPGAPRSHRASHAGINSHKSWVKHGTSNDTVT